MSHKECILRKSTPADSALVQSLITENWGGEPLYIRGEPFFPSRLPGILACSGNKVDGYLFYEIKNQQLEVVIVTVFDKYKGLGTKLLEAARKIAEEQNCTRLFLMTTNDNVDALRFYQTRGFSIYKIVVGALALTRKLMPHLSYLGRYGIPRRDEIYLEMPL